MTLILLSPILLALLYPLAIQYERGGLFKIVIPFFTLPALLIDIIFNLFWVSIIYRDLPFKKSEFLERREFTFSDRLERFIYLPGFLGKLSVRIASILNKIAPSGAHIRSLKGIKS